MPVAHCDGSTMVVAKNAAICDVNAGNQMMVEQGIHILCQNDLHSEMEDEPYLVSHEEASSSCHPVNGRPCDKDAVLPDQTTLAVAAMENSAAKFESHVEEYEESHWKEEVLSNAARNGVRSNSHHSGSQLELADAANSLSENAGADENARPDSLTSLQNGAPREESTLRHEKGDKGSDSGFTDKVTEAKIGEQGQVEMSDPKLEHNGKQQTTKSAKPPRPMRRPWAQNERPSVLIKRRRTTSRETLAMDTVLL